MRGSVGQMIEDCGRMRCDSYRDELCQGHTE